MEREIRAGIGLFFCIVVMVMLFVGLFRFIVPMILEAHFPGSVPVAGATALLGTCGLAYLAAILIGRFARSLRKDEQGEDKSS